VENLFSRWERRGGRFVRVIVVEGVCHGCEMVVVVVYDE
jgi:hypothetical protein